MVAGRFHRPGEGVFADRALIIVDVCQINKSEGEAGKCSVCGFKMLKKRNMAAQIVRGAMRMITMVGAAARSVSPLICIRKGGMMVIASVQVQLVSSTLCVGPYNTLIKLRRSCLLVGWL